MFIKAKLILQSYLPKQLTKGMIFIGLQHKEMVAFTLNYDIHYQEQFETYLQLNGCPVEPHLYIQGNPNVPDETFLIATPEQIGWFDEGEQSDELHDITVKEINNILNNDGWCEVEVEQEHIDDDETQEDYIKIVPVLFENKVTIRYEMEEYEEEYDDNEDFEEEPPLCDHCNGSGEGMYDGSVCSICGGSGVIEDERDDGEWEHYVDIDF